MGFFRKRILKLGNKGLSMVELICGITMLTIIGSSVCSVMVVSADTYNRGSAEAGVQQEAQLVANQISDLLIDSTADVQFDDGNKILTVKQDTRTYTVKLVGNTLYYTDSDESGTEQVMAEGVTEFKVDITDFYKSGSAQLELKFANDNNGKLENSQQKPMNFNITSRNKQTTSVDVIATVTMLGDWLLEPGQEYDFNTTVSPAGLTTVNKFSIANNTSSNTTINPSTGEIKIGLDEKSPLIRVVCSVEQSGTIIAIKYANVYVRQVLTIDVNGAYNATASNGAADKKDGAVYDLSVTVNGNSLDRITDKSYDATVNDSSDIYTYVDPRQVGNWTVTCSSGRNAGTVDTSSGTPRLVLTGDMQDGETVTVTCKSLHADGVNRQGYDYGDIYGDWDLTKSQSALLWDDGWMRQSSNAQANLNGADTIKTTYNATGWKTFYRYRKLDNSGTPVNGGSWDTTHGDANGWAENTLGDSHNSGVINLRPLLTSSMDYRYDYELSVCVRFYDGAGNVVWPTGGDYEDVNMVTDVVRKTQLAFDSDLLGLDTATCNSEASAPVITIAKDTQFNLMNIHNDSATAKVDGIIGIDTTGTPVDNSFNYIFQKKQDDGSWKTIRDNFESTQNGIEVNKTGNCYVTFRNADYDYEGSWRVLVGLKNMMAYDDNNQVNGTKDYDIWAESDESDEVRADGESVFYFNVVAP